ncbi:MAG: PIN domain-containing protein [Caulobacter sp.]|nr:PIN domain-containing protein [Caulobacter sp.]
MIVDSSAAIAILFEEPSRAALLDRLAKEPPGQRLMSAANYLETGAVIVARIDRPELAQSFLETLLDLSGIQVTPLTEDQARIGVQARVRFGRGSGSAAKLNLGDCYAYALAKDLDAPLLFIGDDFSHTDIRPAL